MELHTKIAGVAFEGRAQYVRKIKVGQILRLRRNKDNPYDSNAIEVINTYSNMLGFIPKDIAAQLAPKIDEGCLYIAKVLSVTDNYIGEKVGAEILIQSIEQDEKLFTCCECGKQLSDRSNACPHCGCPTIETLKTIFRIEGTKILDLLDDSKRVVVIPQFITEISSGAFRDKTNIVQIIIRGENVVIGNDAFCGCEALQRAIVEGSIKQIEAGAFKFCRNLEKINLPEGLISIQIKAFWGCASLTNLYIPDSVEHIANNAFEGCTNIGLSATKNFHFHGEHVFKNNELKISPNAKRLLTSCKEHKYNLVGLKEDGTVLVNFEDKYSDFQKKFDNWNNVVAVSMDGYAVVGLKNNGTLLLSSPDKSKNFDNNEDILTWANIVSVAIKDYNCYATCDEGYEESFICIGVKDSGNICISIPNTHIRNPKFKPMWLDEILNWKDIAMVSADKYVVGLKKDGTVVVNGDRRYGVEDVQKDVSLWRDIKYVLTSHYLIVGLREDGTIVAASPQFNYSSLLTDWVHIEKVSIVGDDIYGIREDGTVYSTRNRGLTNFKNVYDVAEGYSERAEQQIFFIKKDGTVEEIYYCKPSQVTRATQVIGEIENWKLLDAETDSAMRIEDVDDTYYENSYSYRTENSGYSIADFGYSQEEYDNYWESTDY